MTQQGQGQSLRAWAQQTVACPQCGGPMRQVSRVCQACRRKGRRRSYEETMARIARRGEAN